MKNLIMGLYNKIMNLYNKFIDFNNKSGCDKFQRVETKKKFADSLIGVGDKLYLAILFAPIGVVVKEGIIAGFLSFIILAFLLLPMAALFRNEGLSCYDKLEDSESN